jgi:hypothetical protein
MTTTIMTATLSASVSAAIAAAPKGLKRNAGAQAIVTSFGGRPIVLRLKSGGAVVATMNIPAGGYSVVGSDILFATPTSSNVPADATPPSLAPFWSLEIEDQGVIKLLSNTVGAVGSVCNGNEISPLKAGQAVSIGQGMRQELKLRVPLSFDPYTPAATTIKAAATQQLGVPHRLAKYFAPGEIPTYPQLVVAGVPSTAQVTIWSRYDAPEDVGRPGYNSVKFAIIRCKLDVKTTDQLITFTDRPAPAYTAATLTGLLTSFPNFDVTTTMRFGTVLRVETVSSMALYSNVIAASLGAASTPLASNISQTMTDAAHGVWVTNLGELAFVPSATATAGNTSVLRIQTDEPGNPIHNITLTVSAAPTVYSVSMRAMMAAGKATIKYSGPECTAVEIADFTTNAYDIGPGVKQAAPIAVVEFFHGTGNYHVAYALENCNTEKVGTFAASASVRIGVTVVPPVATTECIPFVFDSAPVRFNKWALPTFEPDYDHGIAALGTAGARQPIYDIKPTATLENAIIAQYTASNFGLGGSGMWQKSMNSTGGRKDIGLETAWVNDGLLSGKAQLRDIANKQADKFSSFSVRSREGSNRTYGNRGAAPGPVGRGRPRTNQLRRSYCTFSYYSAQNGYANNQPATRPADKAVIVGPIMTFGFVADDSHCPNAYYLLALTSGCLMRMEEVLFTYGYQYSTVGAAECDVSGADMDSIVSSARNVNPNYFGSAGDTRSRAHQLRQGFYAWNLCPTSDPIKACAEEAVTDLVIYDAAYHNVGAAQWGTRPDFVWRRVRLAIDAGLGDVTAQWYLAPNPLGMWERGPYVPSTPGSARDMACWQGFFYDQALGLMARRNFPGIQPVREFRNILYRTLGTHPSTVAKELPGEYTLPTTPASAPNRPINSVAELLAVANKPANYSWAVSWPAGYSFAPEQGYGLMYLAAVALQCDLCMEDIETTWATPRRNLALTGTAPAFSLPDGGLLYAIRAWG